MAKLKFRTISKRTVDALSVEDRDAVFWDDRIPGFGVRVYPSGSKVYVVQTRHRGKSRRVTLGRHGVITADQARKKAAETINRIKSGGEAVERGSVTVAELAARYLDEHVDVRCKESTRKMYRSVVERFIVPSYGDEAVAEVEREHIARLHLELRHIPYQANRALEIGNSLFNLAEEWKLRTGGNPCRYVRKYPETKRERFLTEADLEDVRLHDLRHSFASRALALGESLSMIGKLLGHNKIETTSRYAHLARDSIKASSARVADSIGADILESPAPVETASA